ncbi:MAG: hypothetical protein Q7Q73_17460 [Verrucomicrobiota bacterium JB024]|nr:hypothetical protein [Verrucomicrobiota bacterium JB024]
MSRRSRSHLPLTLITLTLGSLLSSHLCADQMETASYPLNPGWPQAVTDEQLEFVENRPMIGAAEPKATDIFYEGDMEQAGWFTAFAGPMDSAKVKDYEFDNKGTAITSDTDNKGQQVTFADGEIRILGEWDRQAGIRLNPELWKDFPDKEFVLGVEMSLTDLELRGYYLSPQISQDGARGTQRWLTRPVPARTRVEFIAKNNDTPINLLMRGNQGLWTIQRLYLRKLNPADDAFPWPVDATESEQPVTVRIDSSRSLAANPKLLGFNPEFLRSVQGFDSPPIREALELVRPGTLRFPTGTQSNWYDWRADGWPDVDSLPEGTPQFVFDSVHALEKNRGGKLGLSAYQQLVRELNLTPLLVLNILTQSPESQAAWAQDMVEAGAGCQYFELGNETYHWAQANAETATAPQYVEHTRAYAEAIRKVVPEAKFSVQASNRDTRNDDFAWNLGLSAADFADGVTLHTYTFAFAYPMNREMVATLLYPETQLAAMVQLKREQFPQWRIWNTEWGVNAPPVKPYGTQLGALQTAAYLLALVAWEADFELACEHSLGTGEFSPIDLLPDGRMLMKRPLFAFALAGPMFAKGSQWLGTAVDEASPPLPGGYPRVSGRAFRTADGALRVLLVNRLPVEKPIHLELDGQSLPLSGTLRSLTAPTLAAADSVPEGQTMIVSQPLSEGSSLPPFSVNLIELSPAQ